MDKNKIIDVAFKLIIKVGLEEFSIGKLAAELNCTKSSIYNYFTNKDDLLNQIFITKIKVLTQNLNYDDDPEYLIRKYAHNCIENKDVFTFFHKHAHARFTNENTIKVLEGEMKNIHSIVMKLLEKNTLTTKIKPAIIQSLIFGPIHGLIMCSKVYKIETTEEDVDLLVDLILATIRKEKDESNSKEV